MKRYLIFFLSIVFFGCSVKITRPGIEGLVYDKKTRHSITDARIITQDKNGNYTVEARTNEKGIFFLKEKKSRKIFEVESGHDPMIFFFIVSHPLYVSDTIEERTRGSFNREHKSYEIFLTSKKDNE